MPEINEHTKVPFGRRENKNKPLGKVTDKFIDWMIKHLSPANDFHSAAIREKERRVKAGLVFAEEDDLDAQASAILRNAGYGKLAGPYRKANRR